MLTFPAVHHCNYRTVIVSADVDRYHLFPVLGSPANPVDIIVIIESGVTIYSTNTVSAFRTGNIPNGSSVKIINKGRIQGKAGDGGDGGTADGTAGYMNAGSDGDGGSDAIETTIDLVIDNGAGEIWGGGGGGGGGGGIAYSGLGYTGGGGGGGQGNTPGGVGATGPGTPPTSGTTETNGSGGDNYSPGTLCFGGSYSGAGGDGGAAGAAGTAGGGSTNGFYIGGCATGPQNRSGGSGGAAGKAIDLNGNSVKWLSGNTGARVKGAVS